MRKFKHLWITLMTVILAVSLIAGGAGMSAFATYTRADEKTVISTTGLVLPTSVKLGKPIKLGTDDYASRNITIQAPNKSDVTNDIVDVGTDENYIIAKMVGNYTIKYAESTAADAKIYEHNVNVKLDGTFEFRVKDDGASLPTFVNPETDVELPEAALYKLNEDTNEYEKCESSLYDYNIFINNEPLTKNAEGKYAPYKFSARTHSVQYVCTYDGTTQKFIKEYTVKSQRDFKDTVAPKMSISGIPLQGSLNTKITLPKATATDDYDTNVKIVITVKHNNADVLRVVTDEYGYAKELYKNGTETEKVEFDNVYNLSFYPTELGDYLIEYQAFDDAGNKSVKHPDTLVVSDRSAPKLEKIEDSKIPAKWGKSVKTKALSTQPSGSQYASNPIITFPMPKYSDNSLSENIKVSFEIRDTVNNNVVIKFDDIYSKDGTGAKYVYDADAPLKGLYQDANATFTENGFDFTFSKYLVDNVIPTGKYTATYQASDAKPNITSKSYDITLEETFEDIVAPDVTVDTVEYLYVTSEDIDYTLPTAKITDAIDANPTVKYLLKKTDGTTIVEVENGSKIKINDTKITYDKKDYPYTGNIKVEVTGTDDVGNVGTHEERIITIVSSGDINGNITLGINADELRGTNDDATSTSFKTGVKAELGSLTINGVNNTSDDKYRKFLGFELTLQNPEKKVISGLSLETYYKKLVVSGTAGAIQVDNIAFTPSVAGDYTLTVRAFDVSGRSIINVYIITVAQGATINEPISATPIPTTGSIQMNYKLKNETIDNYVNIVSTKKYVVRQISNAGKFSLMGLEFTAYSTGTYNFVDGYYSTDDVTAPAVDKFKKHESYTLAVSDTSSPVFSLLDKMPTHWEKGKDLTLPEVIAYNDYANANIDISVSSPSSTLTLGTQLIPTGNTYKFTPDQDGEYTVTYTASVNNSTEVKQSYKIKVGDVIAPSFKLESSHPTTATQDGKFQFSKVIYDTNVNTDDKIEDVTFTKKLIDPSGETVYTSSAKGTTGRDKIYDSTDKVHTYSMTGTYTVEYTATDKVGNVSTIKETIVVSASGRVSSAPLKILRNVLIIVGIILLGGVIVYFARYYGKGNVKHKSAKESSKKK